VKNFFFYLKVFLNNFLVLLNIFVIEFYDQGIYFAGLLYNSYMEILILLTFFSFFLGRDWLSRSIFFFCFAI